MTDRPWLKFYDDGVPHSIDYEAVTIPESLDRAARRCADRPALTFMNTQLSYREFKDHVDRFATALHTMGVTQGGRVAIQLPNLPQTAIAYYATLRLGAHAVMTNPLYTPREVVHQWNDANTTVAVVLDALYDRTLQPVRDQLPVEHYVIASVAEYLRFPLNVLAPLKLKRQSPPMTAKIRPAPHIRFFRELIDQTSPQPPPVDIGIDDVAMLQYTGGTTGLSKGAMLTHRNIMSNAQQLLAWTNAGDGEEVWMACLPFFHIYGLTVALIVGVHRGAQLILIPNPRDTASIVKSVVKHRVTMLPAVPAMYNAINEYPGVERVDLSSVRICNSGSAPLPVEVLKRFEELTGARITEGFGLTETSPVTHSNPLLHRKVGSIGVPLPDTDAKVVDMETGLTEMPHGEEGELILRGPQIMKGYLDRPEDTAQMIRDGWLYSGDLAVMDTDGYFFIVGRKKDMILCSGYNVYPDEIDRVLMGHPGVSEAATIGVPDAKRGETVKSFVVRADGHSVTSDELIAYCQQELAAYKVPRLIEFRDSLPKSTVLKILRRTLRDEELAKQTQ